MTRIHGIEREIDAIKAHFKKSGLRWTQQRQMIVEQAFMTHSHFSAEDLHRMLRSQMGEQKVHLATVYRTLQVLEEGGFIEGLEVGKGGRLFEHILGHEHHDHIICMDCGAILEFHDDPMEERKRKAAERMGFDMVSHSLQIYGRCHARQSEEGCPRYRERMRD